MERPTDNAAVPPEPQPTWIPSAQPPPPPPPPRKRGFPWIAVVAVIAVLAIVGGVVLTVVLVSNHRADVAADERRESASARASSESAASAASVASVEARESQEEEAALAAAEEAYHSCVKNLGAFYEALTTVDARLDVGLSQNDLSQLVGKASVAYTKIDIDDLGDGNCLFAAAKMESAFNSYNSTVSKWNDCIYDYYCDVDTITPGMQVKWARASTLLRAADKLLDKMDPSSPSYVEGAAGNLVT